jgi:hypothetical protein
MNIVALIGIVRPDKSSGIQNETEKERGKGKRKEERETRRRDEKRDKEMYLLRNKTARSGVCCCRHHRSVAACANPGLSGK